MTYEPVWEIGKPVLFISKVGRKNVDLQFDTLHFCLTNRKTIREICGIYGICDSENVAEKADFFPSSIKIYTFTSRNDLNRISISASELHRKHLTTL